MGRESRMGILDDVVRERGRQVAKWGDRTVLDNSRTAAEWAAILSEETGELSEAAVEFHFGRGQYGDIYDEAIQVAGVAVAIAEAVLNGAIGRRATATPTGEEADDGS